MYVRAMHSTIPGEDLPVMLLCDMEAAFPSVNRFWLWAVMEEAGIGPGAGDASWRAPLAKWFGRAQDVAQSGAPALYRQRALSVLSYVGALLPPPAAVAE